MKKNVQRINESQLRAIVAESVKKVLNEGVYTNHMKPMKATYEKIKELINMWNLVRDESGRYTTEGNKITRALRNVLNVIREVDMMAKDDENENSPYGIPDEMEDEF